MDNFLTEYNNMWNKLNLIEGFHNNLFIFTLTWSGAILAYALQQHNSYIAIINMIILILLRCRVINYRDEYYRILVYIRKVLEPKIGLKSRVMRKLSNTKIAGVQHFMYSILGLGTMLVCLYIDINNKLNLFISILLFIIVSIIDIYYHFDSRILYKEYEKRIESEIS